MTLSAVEIAQKQRHLHLLTRVRNNQYLSRAELAELEQLEKMTKKQKKTVRGKIKKSARGKGKKSAKGGDKRRFRALAAELQTIAAADAEFDSHLSDIFGKYPRVKRAWEDALSQRVEDAIARKFPIIYKEDYRKVSLQQLVEITGRTRRTIYDWLKKGLQRNADGSFYLPSFLIWFERYTIEKLPPKAVAAANPLQAMKAERLELDLARARNQLLDRGAVIAGQIARYQNLMNSLTHKAEELALLCNGQPQAKMAELLNRFFDEVLQQQCQVPEELRLPEDAEKQFEKLLNSLRPEGE